MRGRNKYTLIVFVFLCAVLQKSNSQDDFADNIIKVTANDSVGNFDLHGTQAQIVGIAYLSNPNMPDIFIQSSALYPDFNRYKCLGRDKDGVPVFGEKIRVTLSSITPGDIFPSHIFQTADKKVHIVWYSSGSIRYGLYNEQTNDFVQIRSVSYSNEPLQLSAYFGSDNKLHVILSYVTVGGLGVAVDGLGKYNGAGIYRGRLNFVGLYEISFSGLLEGSPTSRRLISSSDVRMRHNAISKIDLKQSVEGSVVTGSQFGEISYYENIGSVASPMYQEKKPIVNALGQTIRHPAIAPYPIAYPDQNGKLTDILASSEGSICYYKFTGAFNNEGNPVYEDPVQVLRKGADLVGGSLIVPSVVDWDGDGNLDIVTGNSMGFVYFFKNHGDNINYAFSKPNIIRYKDGEPVFIQGGYGETTQGVYESRWGYTSPNIIDWDGDGYLDILMGDARGKHPIFRGSANGMEEEESLYLNGLNFHGNWRDRPGIAVVGDSVIYITFDEDNHFHLYKKADSYNLLDGGKLKLTDGRLISSDRGLLNAYNESGRAKFDIVDWDKDGLLDLLIGTTGAMAIPDPSTGLPQKGDKKANVLFMKNTGTNMQPRYQFPVALTYKGKKLNFGWHEIGVVATTLGGSGEANLMVGDEKGRHYLFEREYLSNTSTKYLGVPVEIISTKKYPVRIVANDVKIFSDKDYKFQDSLSVFTSNRFVQIYSENPADYYVRPLYTGVVYIATDASTLPVELSNEWKKMDYKGLKYGLDKNNTESFTIYRRDSKEGEKLHIPQLGTLGTIVLSTNITEGEDDPSATEDISIGTKYKIYPNPARHSIRIDNNDGLSEHSLPVRIFTILGETIYSDVLQQSTIIDVSTYQRGLHIITIGNHSEKLLIY